MYGWAGTILRVDLSSQKVKKEPFSIEIGKRFIGGRGVNSFLLYEEVGPSVEPFSPENCVIIGCGPLSGSLAPSTPRCTITAKSPLTGILGDANFGGYFGPEMKFAGYDHIVIQGKAEKPEYLWIEDDEVEVRSAEHLWGKTTWDTERLIKEELGDPNVQVISIGPAGENLVRMACVIHGHDVAGRTGMGAVMGSKNLKAVAVRGSKGVKIAKPEVFRDLVRTLRKKIRQSPFYQTFSTYGMAGPLAIENEIGMLAVRNMQQTAGFEGVENITCETLAEKFFTGSTTCFSCMVGCMKHYEVKEGPYAGEKGTKMPEGCTSPCGPNCGNSYAPSLFKINNLVNQLGIDVMEYGGLMATAMEWYEKGILTREDTEGIELTWGNHQAMVEMISKIARREGIGDLFADGTVRAAKKLGKEAERYVSHCKGQTVAGGDMRALKGTALCFAVGTRGCDHLRGTVMIEVPFKGMTLIQPEEAKERFGTEEVLTPGSYEKAKVVVFYQDVYTLADALEICKFTTSHNGQGINIKDMAELFSAVTGIDMDEGGMRKIADRIYNLERAYSVREGIKKQDDFLQGKWASEPVQSGPFTGEFIDPKKWGKMLEDYYELRGWDKKTGVPTKERLKDLGLNEVAGELGKMGKYK